MTDRWRNGAHLRKENWPEAIAWEGPHQEYDPLPWSHYFAYSDLPDVDAYPSNHASAGSIGDTYMGDVCPYCGVPISWLEEVKLEDGTQGELADISEVDEPEPAWHPECWHERSAEKAGLENTSLGEWE